MNNLLTAIMTKIADTDLNNAVGGRIYLDRAPENTEFPYVVFFIVSYSPDNTFAEKLEDVVVQFSIYSLQPGPTEIIGIYYYLKTLFDDCDLNIERGELVDLEDWNELIWFKRQNLTTMVDDITTPTGTVAVKHWAVDYSIYVRVDEC